MTIVEGRLPLRRKLHVAWRVWRWFVVIQLRLLRPPPLPLLVEDLLRVPSTSRYAISPHRLGRTVHKVLRMGPYRPRCLVTSLIFLRLLSEQGAQPVLVIGLPPQAVNQDAHAWIELEGVEVGPPPGSAGHTELARFGPSPH